MKNFILQLQLFMLCGAGTAFSMFGTAKNLEESQKITNSQGVIQPEEHFDSGMSSLLEDDNTQDDGESISDMSWLSDINSFNEDGAEEILYATIDDPDKFLIKLEPLNEEYSIFNSKLSKIKERHPVLDALKSLEVSNVSDIQSWMLENKGFLFGKNYIKNLLGKKGFLETPLANLKEIVRESYRNFPALTLEERVLKIRQEKIILSLNDIEKIKEALEVPEKWEDFEREWNKRNLKEIKNENEEKKVNRIFELFQKFGPLCEIIQSILRQEGFKVSLDSIRCILGVSEIQDNETKRKRNQKVLELFDQGERTFKIMKETRIPLKSFYSLLKRKRPEELELRKEEAENKKEKKTKLALDLYDIFNFSIKEIEFWMREGGFRFGENFVSDTLKANNRAVRPTTRDKYSPEQRQKVIKLYLLKVEIKKISEETKIPSRTINRYIKEYKKENGESKDEKKAKVIELYLSGVPIKEFAKESAVCLKTARKYIKEYEEEKKAKVIELYLSNGKMEDIALQTGIPEKTVHDYIKEYEEEKEKEENQEEKTSLNLDPEIQSFIEKHKKEKGESKEEKTRLILALYDNFGLSTASKIEVYLRTGGFKFKEDFVRCALKDNDKVIPQATQKKYSSAQKKKVIDLHLSGASTAEIVEQTGVLIGAVRDYIQKHKKKNGESKDKQKKEVIDLHLSGISTAEIVKQTGVLEKKVEKYIRKYEGKKEDIESSRANSSKLSVKNKKSKKIRKV